MVAPRLRRHVRSTGRRIEVFFSSEGRLYHAGRGRTGILEKQSAQRPPRSRAHHWRARQNALRSMWRMVSRACISSPSSRRTVSASCSSLSRCSWRTLLSSRRTAASVCTASSRCSATRRASARIVESGIRRPDDYPPVQGFDTVKKRLPMPSAAPVLSETIQ